MGIGLPKDIADAMVASGLVPEATTIVRDTPNDVDSEVSTVESFEQVKSGSAGYVPPPWLPRLRMAMLSPNERGACLFGPRGTGKTRAVHEVAQSEGKTLITFQAAAGCTIDDLVGVRDLIDGKTVFTPGPLPEALAKDAWLCIEEANVMHPGVFSKLNTLTDGSGDKLRLPDGQSLEVGPNFRVVLCFNEGASYAGTREVNAALRDRLMPVYTEYLPEADEVRILRDRTGVDKTTATGLVAFANNVRKARAQLGFDISPRALFRLVDTMRVLKPSWEDAFSWVILDLVGDPTDKKPVRDAIREIADLQGMFVWDAPSFTVEVKRKGKGKPADEDELAAADEAEELL